MPPKDPKPDAKPMPLNPEPSIGKPMSTEPTAASKPKPGFKPKPIKQPKPGSGEKENKSSWDYSGK